MTEESGLDRRVCTLFFSDDFPPNICTYACVQLMYVDVYVTSIYTHIKQYLR